MKLSNTKTFISDKSIEKRISKKILLANTDKNTINSEVLNKSQSVSSNPLYYQNSAKNIAYNPDIRYQQNYNFSPLTMVNYRNDLLIFAENDEIADAIDVLAKECCVTESELSKYPVNPEINKTFISLEKHDTANAMTEYLTDNFFPKLWKYYNLGDDGLIDLIKEYLICGKLAFEIVYDNIKKPTKIIGIIPIDVSSLSKIKEGDYIYYVQKDIVSNKERILTENQLIIIEYNKYDYGYVSYVDKLRLKFNIMRNMQTAKILWFATKSQVRMHIKFALGDLSRTEAEERLSEAVGNYTNQYMFDSGSGNIMYNNQPLNTGYREFFTAETSASGHPEIEEINTNGPDLTEVDSLQFFEKMYWKATKIPYDRIDPNSSDSWGFTDVANLRKIEINFGKFVSSIRKKLNILFIKPIIIQLTLQEIEIGADLELLDSIKMNWVAFNEYEKLAELEVLNKKVEVAQAISSFGELEDAEGNVLKTIPTDWLLTNILDFNKDEIEGLEESRIIEQIKLGFLNKDEVINNIEKEKNEAKINSKREKNDIYETPKELIDADDKNYRKL